MLGNDPLRLDDEEQPQFDAQGLGDRADDALPLDGGMPPDDGLQFDQELDATVNRPASNARVTSPTEGLSDAFGGRDGAEDFLGLTGDVPGEAGGLEPLAFDVGDGAANEVLDASFASGLEAELEVDEAGELQLANGWLLELPTEAPEETTATPAPPGAVGEEWDDEALVATAADGDELDEGDALEGEEAEAEVRAAASRARRTRILAGAGFVVGMLGFTLYYGWIAKQDGGATEVARAPAATPEAVTDPAPADPATGDAATGDEPNAADAADPAAGHDAESSSALAGLLGSAPGVEPRPAADEAPDSVPFDGELVGPPAPAELGDEPRIRADERARDRRTTVLTQLDQAVGTAARFEDGPYDPAREGLIWTGLEVPFHAVEGDVRLQTPAVGMVRATMASGEIFEGRLFAVGLDRVWIEMGPGRLGLDGSLVESIDRLAGDEAAETAEAAVPGQRVRVRTAGGVLYGKVKTVDGNRVTLITDKGGRITLTDPVIEAIGRVSGLVLEP